MAPPPLSLTATAAGAAALPLPHPPRLAALLRRPLHPSGRPATSRRGRVAPGSLHSSRKCNLYHQKSSRRFRDAAGWSPCSQLKVEGGVDDETCELVNGVELVIGEGEDIIKAYLLKAVKNNNGIGILLLSDIFGFEDSSTREFAYRVACNGYNSIKEIMNQLIKVHEGGLEDACMMANSEDDHSGLKSKEVWMLGG